MKMVLENRIYIIVGIIEIFKSISICAFFYTAVQDVHNFVIGFAEYSLRGLSLNFKININL